MLQLSERLLAVASMVSEKSRLADVGTDHGYIPIFLCMQGKIPSAIAMDIRSGPLDRAKENIRLYGLMKCIETRLSDGVEKLKPEEADAVVIAGMGGGLVCKILEEGRQVLESVNELILQPQSDIDQVRRYLQNNNWKITAEKMVCEDGKYYPMMHVVHGHMEPLADIEWKYGQFLLKEKNPVLGSFLDKEEAEILKVMENLRTAGSEKALVRLKELEELLAMNRKAQCRMC
ncbi:MAG: class I SAM-dependent methyltransferase [Hominisplanchenecus sp.]|nr:class I SAM-dependent methyltransferase [Lachnospiraceae bacterium]MDY2818960.1 class I SAM-dependent methyltransferase [Hominisplanchenecus sp.]